MKVIICVALLTFGAVVKAQQDYQDYWDNDYANYDDYNLAVGNNDDPEVKSAETKQGETNQEVTNQGETNQGDTTQGDLLEGIKAPTEVENDKFDDYQIEDNRSDAADKEAVEEIKEVVPEESPATEKAQEHEVLPLDVLPLVEPEQNDEDLDLKELGLDEDNSNIVPLPVPEAEDDDNDNIFEETKDLLNKEKDYLDEIDQVPVDNDSAVNKMIEETKQILDGYDDTFDANNFDNFDVHAKSDEDVLSEISNENNEDSPAKVYADLNADLDKLFETLDKLRDNTDEKASAEEEEATNIKDYEEKYDKPFNEDVALSWRNAESDDAAAPVQSDEVADEQDDEAAADDFVSDEETDDDYEKVDDSNLSQIFAENASNETATNNKQDEKKAKETTEAPLEKIDEIKEIIDYVDNYDEPNDSEPNADDDIDSVIKQIFAEDVTEPKPYGEDALVDDKSKEEAALELDEVTTSVPNESTQKTAMLEDLNSAELSDLTAQFVAAHKDELDVNSESFTKNVPAIHITLSLDEAVEVTSPNFPASYPGGRNTIDWIFDGPGVGIEMNITDLNIQGASGDYLLVKPGGLDASGQDGLVFTHLLKSVRKYRFADVDRMFVRFESFANWVMLERRFRFTVKLMKPLPTIEEDEPVAEPVANAPQETLTLNLAGLTLSKFEEVEEQFREMLADMAKEYIRDNNITLGLNTTYEITQITRKAVCNIQWPEYENCVELTFGVPLHYDEEPEEPRLTAEDLDDMWTSYISEEKYAERLRSLGITEYAIPNDRTVLMVWLVIAGGVLISMAMLAFALWRFSCFEDYTRMQTYGDTDSIQNEKRHLDLYPTPHQTLPPLYSENDYKWADDKYDDSTRVDMGGFANRSYIRDELYDLDSDEDVIAPRDRKGAISPRDFSNA